MAGRLLLCGRDFGFWEQREGRPFVGPAGNLLNRALKAAGIDRERECVVTNVCNKKPKADEWRLHAPGDVAAGMAALQELCRLERPAMAVALGEQALSALVTGDPDAGFHRVTESRGYVFPSPLGFPVLSSTHPAFCLRAWFPWYPLLVRDLQKARRVFAESTHGGWKGGASAQRADYWEMLHTVVPTYTVPNVPTAIDIETNADLGIACIGWAFSADTGQCAPFREEFFPFFHRLLESPAPKVMMNGQFDSTILERNGFAVQNWSEDIMLQWHSVEPMLAGKTEDSGAKPTHKSLRFLASILTDEPYWKDYQFETEDQRYRLCAKDSRITLEIYEALQEQLG